MRIYRQANFLRSGFVAFFIFVELVAFYKTVDTAFGVDNFLRAGVVGVAVAANFYTDIRLGRTNLNRVAAHAGCFDFVVFRVYGGFHFVSTSPHLNLQLSILIVQRSARIAVALRVLLQNPSLHCNFTILMLASHPLVVVSHQERLNEKLIYGLPHFYTVTCGFV